MTLRPLELDESFVRALKVDGLDDLAIREAANVGFHYNMINRIADAFDFPIPRGRQKARLAVLLNMTGKLLRGTSSENPWIRGDDGIIRPTEVELGRERLLSAEGKTEPELRRRVEVFVLSQWDVRRPGGRSVPDALGTYLVKLSLHAHRITDEDVAALRRAEYSDEMIYEITIVGAFGAALAGLESLFAALYGGDHASTVRGGES